jgi:catechol 2,3-dioxygenase-like lactoylglutathione lyase family enzyme
LQTEVKSVPELSATRLDHVGLSVGNLDVLGAWYCSALGLAEEARFSYAIGHRQVTGVLLSSTDGWRLELQQCEGSEPGKLGSPREALLRQGLGHFCLRVDDIDATFALLVERGAGVSFPPTASPLSGMRVGYLTDPEGNFIELLEQREALDG